MIPMTAKQLQLSLKRATPLEELCKKYNCSSEEIKSRIEHLYCQGSGSKAASIFKELENNSKKAAQAARKRDETKVSNASTIKPEEISPEIQVKDSPVGEPVPANPANPTNPDTSSLEELTAEEGRLSREVMKLEAEHKDLAQQRRPQIATIRELQKELKIIESKLDDCRQKYEDAVGKANLLADEMNEKSRLRQEKLSALEAVREQIRQKKTIPLFVYNDGRIEAPDNPDFEIDESGYEELKEQLIAKEECQDLRVRDIVTLAKLIKVSEKAETISVVCENPDLEAAFALIRES